VDRDLLRLAATRPAYYYEAPRTEDLAAIYEEIAEALPCARP
jgi:hypothetical protein